jgi:ABC-2 type transport system permease protein
MIAIYLAVGVLLSAAATAPFLMVEEKQSKTLDSLLVSPANYVQIVLSKFITGLVPGLIAGLLILGINFKMVTHWPFAILMLLLGDAMVVLIGLWLGISSNHPVNLSLFMLVILILLITPILITPSIPPHWPALAKGIVNYFPSTAFSRLMRDALTLKIHFSTILPDLLSLAGCSVIFFGLLVRKLSRLDR